MPGKALLSIYPQATLPAQHGALTITDGAGIIKIPECRVSDIKYSAGRWILTIADPRWKWQELGLISGCYNQLDPHGRLIPWTVRTVPQLMALCFAAMLVDNYVLNLPTVQAATSDIFPATDWDGINPAQALTGLAEKIGCRIVPRWSASGQFAVLVTPLGEGADLPRGGSVRTVGPTLHSPEAPDSIYLLGAPIRFQVRFPLVAVGEEWDGSIRDINELSYAPLPLTGRHTFVIAANGVTVGSIFTLRIYGLRNDDQPEEISVTSVVGTAAEVAALFIAAINDAPELQARGITARANTPNSFFVEGPLNGDSFGVETSATGDAALEWELFRQGRRVTNRWSAGPPMYVDARATDRLSKRQALALAQKCIYKWYRVINADPAVFRLGVIRPLEIPTFGALARIQQVLLQDTQCEQVTPQPGDPDKLGPDGLPLDRPYYNGFSRDKPAQVFGSYYPDLFNVTDPRRQDPAANTKPGEEVRGIDFSIDSQKQIVQFSQPMFLFQIGGCEPADLTLQTACQIRDAISNQVVRYQRQYIPANAQRGTPPATIRREDVQLNVVTIYSTNPRGINLPIGVVTDDAEAQRKAEYYLLAEARRFDLSAGQEKSYNGIVPIFLDGAIQQVTWQIGGGEAPRTIASRNSEHALYVPTYPERIMLQYLPPAAVINNVAPPRPEAQGRLGPSMWNGKLT